MQFSLLVFCEIIGDMKSIVVLYHSNCPDGFGAAYAAWKKFGSRAEYIAVSARKLPPKMPKSKDVYILDNSYSSHDLKKLTKTNKSVTVIDHHISAEKDVRTAPRYVFDNNHSGAVLSWKFFHSQKSVPVLLKYVENADIWKWKMPYGLEISTYLASEKFDFKKWDTLAQEFEKKGGVKKYALYGATMLKYLDRLVEEIVKRADLVRFEGRRVLAANCPNKKLTSAVGEALYQKHPPMSVMWYKNEKKLGISLRSNGKVDVSKIAGKYGGGGHKAAAAFVLPWNKGFPWKILKKQ